MKRKEGQKAHVDIPSQTFSSFARAGWCVPSAFSGRGGRWLSSGKTCDWRKSFGLLLTDFFTNLRMAERKKGAGVS